MNSVASNIRWILNGKSGFAATLQTLLAGLFTMTINVATGIITARALGPEGRGEQAAMILWSIFLASAMTLGLPSSLIYNFKRYPKEKSELFSAALFLGTMLGLVASLTGIVFIPWWLAQYSSEVTYLAQLLMLNAPIVLLLLVFSAALEAEGKFIASNQIRFLTPLIALVALGVLELTGTLTPFTAALAYVLNGVPIFLLTLARLWQLFQPHWHGLLTSCSQLLHYGFRSYGIDLLNSLASQVDQVLVVGLLSPASMGTYVVALSLSRMLNVFQTSIIRVLFPRVAARPTVEVVDLVGQTTRVCTALSLPSSVALMLLGPALLRLLYGSEFMEAVTVFRILLIQVVLADATMILAQAFMALGQPGIITVLQGIGIGLNVLVMLVLVPSYGLVGAGLALLGSTIARLAFILTCYPLILKVHPPNLVITKKDLQLLRQMNLIKS